MTKQVLIVAAVLLTAAGTKAQDCYFKPSRLNTRRGDAVIVSSPGGIIYKLLASLGQRHSHSGMALSDTQIRHNTMDAGSVETVDSGLIPVRLKDYGSNSIGNGSPGVLTQDVTLAVETGEFPIPDGVVLTSTVDENEFSSSRAAQLAAAADMIERFRGTYSFYAYTDIGWIDPFDPDHAPTSNGNMCAGTVYHAHKQSQNLDWNSGLVRTYPTDIRRQAGDVLFGDLKRTIKDEPDFIGTIAFGINSLFGGESLDEFANHAANQIVNCMGLNDCSATDDRWKTLVGEGHSLAPDDLLSVVVAKTLIYMGNGQDSPFAYNAMTDLSATENYYCCVDPESASTTCS